MLNVEGGPLQAEARVSATLHADLQARTVELADWVTTATLPGAKGGTVALTAQGRAAAALETEGLEVQLAGQLDESRFEGRWGLRGFGAPAHDFDLDVDRIDLDRYRAAGAPAAAGPEAGGADAPLDLSALRELNATGRVRVGTLKAAVSWCSSCARTCAPAPAGWSWNRWPPSCTVAAPAAACARSRVAAAAGHEAGLVGGRARPVAEGRPGQESAHRPRHAGAGRGRAGCRRGGAEAGAGGQRTH